MVDERERSGNMEKQTEGTEARAKDLRLRKRSKREKKWRSDPPVREGLESYQTGK